MDERVFEVLFKAISAVVEALQPFTPATADIHRMWYGPDLWILGQHRLLCGDATSAADVQRVLMDAKPVLMVTDPPFGISLDGTWRDRAGLNRATGRLQTILIDAVGIGYNFAQHVADQGFDVYLFNAGHRAIDNERFANSKAESYWSLREWMQRGSISGLNDLETEAQLSSIRYRTTPSGQTAIESKEDARKRGVRSPDRAEAMVLAFWKVVPRRQIIDYTQRVEISRY